MSSSAPRRFIDSIEREGQADIRRMRKVYGVDPTPALKERIERAESSLGRKIRALRLAHERFEKVMAPSDDELSAAGSAERGERLIGDPILIDRIRKRKMGRAEYHDILYGPDEISR